MTLETLSGWGGVPRAVTRVVDVTNVEEARSVLAQLDRGDNGLIVRGLGRSYGDAAQRSDGITLRLESASRPTWVDPAAGVLRCPASVSIGDLVEFAAPEGYFVPVTPGTRYVTVGGAVAADIHGKDHHVASSFGSHVERLSMLLADGTLVEVGPDLDSDLFNATVGGLGLTGVILSVDIRMLPVAGHSVAVETTRTRDLADTMARLTEAETAHRYSVAWVDLATSGSELGRGVITNGSHTENGPENGALRRPRVGIPGAWGLRVVTAATIKAFNELWYRKAPKATTSSTQSYDKFFYPLDGVRDWNRLYGRRGFLQYQLVLPLEAEDQLGGIADSLATAPAPVALAVLKRFGPEGNGHISFPKKGWTLAADLPVTASFQELEAALRVIDEQVVAAGGRVYLAKDSRLGADLVPAMYPRLGEFQSIRDRVDPNRRFQSDLSARLGL